MLEELLVEIQLGLFGLKVLGLGRDNQRRQFVCVNDLLKCIRDSLFSGH